jgi:hypothetical protein
MSQRISTQTVWLVQAVVVTGVVASLVTAAPRVHQRLEAELTGRPVLPEVAVPRDLPLRIEPLYDDPEVVSDEELAAVLKKVQPRFPKSQLKPNFVEHALRTWWLHAEFQEPGVMSGQELKDYLVDHGKYLASWGEDVSPLLVQRRNGVAIRWGKENGASVHHDHWLASLTEAGVSLHEPVFTPSRSDMTINHVLQEALRDFRLDEIETEWSALAFGLWLPPANRWQTSDGRELSFDLLAGRLMRGDKRLGVCAGTHRAYSLMVLIRLDDEFHILSPEVRQAAWAHLERVRDLIRDSQFPDGHWPSNWAEGQAAVEKPIADELFKQVIATGHHLEWLAIAPTELHPPRELILKAADWVIRTTTEQTDAQILERYTFFSHVGNALALWRRTHPADFWKAWEARHPYDPEAPLSALESL